MKNVIGNFWKSYKADKTFKGDAPLGWKCRNCGYVHMAEEAPEVCPVCAHPKAYFERKVEKLLITFPKQLPHQAKSRLFIYANLSSTALRL